jgi:hypothetical protein
MRSSIVITHSGVSGAGGEVCKRGHRGLDGAGEEADKVKINLLLYSFMVEQAREIQHSNAAWNSD